MTASLLIIDMIVEHYTLYHSICSEKGILWYSIEKKLHWKESYEAGYWYIRKTIINSIQIVNSNNLFFFIIRISLIYDS